MHQHVLHQACTAENEHLAERQRSSLRHYDSSKLANKAIPKAKAVKCAKDAAEQNEPVDNHQWGSNGAVSDIQCPLLVALSYL